MAYEQTVIRRATARLEAQRRDREEALERRREELYRAIPELGELDRQLRRTVLEVAAVAFQGSGEGSALEEVRRKNLALQQQRADLLTSHGYSPSELDPAPQCPQCEDTGWRGGEMCVCLRRLCAEEQVRELSSLLNLGEQSFDAFDLDFYSPLPREGREVTPRQNMEMVREICWNYADKFGRFPIHNLFLSGPPGLGKTFLSACIARTVAEHGFSVVYDTAINVFRRFEAEKFSKDEEDLRLAKDETRRYLRCDLLILDDLGSELTTPFVQTALYQLVNERLAGKKHTVISSNLSMAEVARRYLPQTASRLEGEYRVLPFFGEDIRLQKKQRL